MDSMIALFPGQGAQHVGMGKSLYENFSTAKEAFEEASDAIHQDLKKLCFEGPESNLTLTENTQPALVTTEIAAFRCAQKEFGFKPKIVAGHSLGEYAALVAATAWDLSTAVKFVKKRGQAMQKAVPAGKGKMAALLNIDEDSVIALCKEATSIAHQANPTSDFPILVEPANFNAPGQIVIAGESSAVDSALKLISDGKFKAKAIPLAVSAPFHCKLMKPARDEMETLFKNETQKGLKMGDLICPYIPNRTARLTSEKNLILELLIEQIDHAVLWRQSIELLLSQNETSAIEFGPGKVLAGLCKRIAKNKNLDFEVKSIGDIESLKTLS